MLTNDPRINVGPGQYDPSKVEKHVAMTSLANTSGNKSQYMAQSAAPRSMSQHVA